jgi:hypothetical protein
MTVTVERTVGYFHILLITTGSVASIKAPLIVAELLRVCPRFRTHTRDF